MNIILGISGGIAAYKACDIINLFKIKGHSVRAVMTQHACELMSSTAIAALTRTKVYIDMWADSSNGSIEHIDAVQNWADVFVVAPATADIIAKFAHGIADDYLSTMYLAAKIKKFVAPAMNNVMWESNPVQRNIEILKKDGVLIIDPIVGNLACGASAIGKLAKPKDIVDFILKQKI